MTKLSRDIDNTIERLARSKPDIWMPSACGVTRSQRSIPALLHRDAHAPVASRARVLVVGGLSERLEDASLALEALRTFAQSDNGLPDRVALSAVPCVNFDSLIAGGGPGNGKGSDPGRGYPPTDGFFYDPSCPESRYLWRWACFQAPDLILELRSGQPAAFAANAAAGRLGQALGAGEVERDDSLLAAIGSENPSGLAPVPGLRLTVPPWQLAAELNRLWNALDTITLGASPARQTLDARRSRSHIQTARILASVYGRRLDDPIMYTQGVGISGRLRLAALDASTSTVDVAPIVEPYVSGVTDPFGESPATHRLAGVVWADELADITSHRQYADLLVRAANAYASGGSGEAPLPADPDFRTEDMFLTGTILGRAYRITGDRRFAVMLSGLLLSGSIQQDNGLFWHCRSAHYCWGRGNGFAALGLAESLTYLPSDHPGRDAILTMYRRLMDGVRSFQQPSGMYTQVMDFPGSYQEHTATSMIGCAMARGVRMGWLDASYRPSLDLAWRGVSERVDEEGGLVDSCTGTGVQDSISALLERPAITGYDDRGGSMALWFATEMERLLREEAAA